MTRDEALYKVMKFGRGYYNIDDFEFFRDERVFEIAGEIK